MRKLTGLLAGGLGLAALAAFILVVVLLFGGLRACEFILSGRPGA